MYIHFTNNMIIYNINIVLKVVSQTNIIPSKEVTKKKKKTTSDVNHKYDFQNDFVPHVKKTYNNVDCLCYICEKSFDYPSDLQKHNHSAHRANKGNRIFII